MMPCVVVLDPPADAEWARAFAAQLTGVEFLVPAHATEADESTGNDHEKRTVAL